MDGPGNKFANFVLFAAVLAGGVWVFRKLDDTWTTIVANHGGSSTPLRTARFIGEQIGIDWSLARFPIQEFARGIVVEMEHGKTNRMTNVTNDDVLLTGKIAWAHLNEIPDYYTRLDQMEREGLKHWGLED